MTKDERYNRSEKGRARYRRYRDSEKGRSNERRVHARLRFCERAAQIQRNERTLLG